MLGAISILWTAKMLRHRLGLSRKPPDPRRTELLALIKAAPNVPAPTRALALLGVSAMRGKELDAVLDIARELEPFVAAGDIDGIREKLATLNLPPDVMKMAEDLLNRPAPTHKGRAEPNGEDPGS